MIFHASRHVLTENMAFKSERVYNALWGFSVCINVI